MSLMELYTWTQSSHHCYSVNSDCTRCPVHTAYGLHKDKAKGSRVCKMPGFLPHIVKHDGPFNPNRVFTPLKNAGRVKPFVIGDCTVCGEPFVKNAQESVCSDRCKNWLEKRNARKAIEKECPICGLNFTPGIPSPNFNRARYCTFGCAQYSKQTKKMQKKKKLEAQKLFKKLFRQTIKKYRFTCFLIDFMIKGSTTALTCIGTPGCIAGSSVQKDHRRVRPGKKLAGS